MMVIHASLLVLSDGQVWRVELSYFVFKSAIKESLVGGCR